MERKLLAYSARDIACLWAQPSEDDILAISSGTLEPVLSGIAHVGIELAGHRHRRSFSVFKCLGFVLTKNIIGRAVGVATCGVVGVV